MKKIVAVIGSSGAIGNALSNRLLEDDSVETIYKFSRSQKSKTIKKKKISSLILKMKTLLKNQLRTSQRILSLI
jgi:N-acetyl-gamma-glutamylphosphate reductase